jgi:hypothetical protein|tara:strand:+ start:71 stop:637 length:567 start_codon:yes stop_codon:yes gene_type:complete
MKLTTYIAILISFALLQGCVTTNPDVAKLKVTKATIKEEPKWFTKLPKSKKILYAKGTALSGDMQLSLDKATIAAKRSLAETLDSYISSKTKTFVTETGMDEASTMYSELEQVTINSIKEAHIIGFKEYKSKTIGIGSKYRTYYVMEYPIGKANKILISQIKNNALLEGSVQASAAYKDLEKEIQGSD